MPKTEQSRQKINKMKKQFANILREPFARLGLHEQYDWVKLPWKGVFNYALREQYRIL